MLSIVVVVVVVVVVSILSLAEIQLFKLEAEDDRKAGRGGGTVVALLE